ncbi:MAG: hypothetical protein R3302_00075 [Sulfurimonadaceae bacterium]|nr:hypothetical protein [Sulfurimonadaceae bacterium]
MTDTTYDTIKTIFSENERLFTKLKKVADEYDDIDFDESGFYDEEVERCERHWNKLANKLLDALREGVEDAEINVLKNKEPNIRSIRFDIVTENEEEKETTRLSVDYSVAGQIGIERQG